MATTQGLRWLQASASTWSPRVEDSGQNRATLWLSVVQMLHAGPSGQQATNGCRPASRGSQKCLPRGFLPRHPQRSAGHTHELLPWPFRGVLCRGSERSALPESPLLPSAVRQTGSASGGVLAFGLASHGLLSTGLGVLQGRAVSEMEKYGRSPFKRQFVEKFRMMALYRKTDMRN